MVSRGTGLFLFLTGGVLVPIGGVLMAIPGVYSTGGTYLLTLGGVLLGIACLTSLKVILPSRPGRVVDFLEALLHSGLLFLVLLAAFRIVAAHPVRRDFTEERIYTLSPQSKAILAKLDTPVQATGFLRANDPRLARLRALFLEYSQATPLFTARILDPAERPSEVARLGVAGVTCVVLEAGTRAVRVRTFEEPHMTGGIVRLTRPALKVGFVSGHRERELKASARDQLSGVLETLELENIEATRVTLGELPPDLKVLVFAGPKSDLLPAEVPQVEKFVAGGGGVLFALELAADPQPRLKELLGSYGVVSDQALVLDMDQHAKNDAGTLLLDALPAHDVTRGVAGLLLPGCRPVAPRDPPPKGVEMEVLAATSEKSFAEFDAPRDFGYTEGRDIRGPVPLAQAIVLPKGRVVVVGNSLFMSDIAFAAKGNREFLLNALVWLARTGDLPGILPDSRARRLMSMEADELGVMVGVTCFGMPFVTLLVGVFGWLYRR